MTFKPLTRDEKAAIWWGVPWPYLAWILRHPTGAVAWMRDTHASGGDVFTGYQYTRTHLVCSWDSVVVHRTSGEDCTSRCTDTVSSRWPTIALCNPSDRRAGHVHEFERVGTYRTSSISWKRLIAWAAQLPDELTAPILAVPHDELRHATIDVAHWATVGLLGPREEPVSPIVNRGPVIRRAPEPASVPSAAGDQFLLFGGAA